MKKILITGANSYIGTSVEKYLAKWPESYKVDTIDMEKTDWKEKDFSQYDAVFHVAGLIAGNKTVTAKYFADAMYAFNATGKDFTISKLQSSVEVTTSDINVSDVASISIVGPNDFNGTAVVEIAGATYAVELINGKGVLPVEKLANGTYGIIVTLEENDKYL